MEAKTWEGTVMSKEQALAMSNYQSQIRQYLLDGDILWWEEMERFLKAQDEISFKAGVKEVVEWIPQLMKAIKKRLCWIFWAFIVLCVGIVTFLLAYRIVFD